MCQVSGVTCHVTHVFFFSFFLLFSDKLVKLIGGGSVINGPTPSSFYMPCEKLAKKIKKISKINPVVDLH